tara:strand:+ start:266 stop:475 length:210 start_codon:yes stop_codon:yes gene_type:complete
MNVTQEHIDWVIANPAIFRGNSRPSKDEKLYIYKIYNEIYNDSRKPNGCGACLRTTVEGISKAIEKHNK